ncbi:MAG: OmpA family protein [Chthoniobacteraceae bacterium]
MKVKAKCHNFSGCLQAYRGEEVELESGAPLVCPECGKALTVTKRGAMSMGKMIPIAIGVVVLALAAFLTKPLWDGSNEPKKDGAPTVAETTPRPEPPPVLPGESPVAGARPVEPEIPATTDPTPTVDEAPAAEPPAMVTAPEKIDVDPGSAENKKVKQEVLTRIDLMPNISEQNKDKLYNSVERARSMGKILTVPFGSGKTSLSGDDVQSLQQALENPEIAKLREDPTAVFVILGYADPKGDAKKNLQYSQDRADAVMAAMRDKGGVQNVMHAVAMGSSTLLDSENLEKNRIAEVWVVLP